MMRSMQLRAVRATAGLAVGGICLQFGGCLSGVTTLIGGTNPCGSILNCDPTAWEFVTSGINGPGVQPDIDPFCSFAPFCDAAQDPIFGGLGGTANP